MVSRSLLAIALLSLHYPITSLALPSQMLEPRGTFTTTTTTTTTTPRVISTRTTTSTTSKSSTMTTKSSTTTTPPITRTTTTRTSTTTAIQSATGTCFKEINTFPNGPTTSVCYDTTYYRTIDLGQVHNYQTVDLLKQCEASCLGDSQCTAYVLAMQLAVDSDLATGVCFFYNHTPKPRPCTDASKRRLFAEAKGPCNARVISTIPTRSSPSTTATATSTFVPGAPGNPTPDYNCTTLNTPCGPSNQGDAGCFCAEDVNGSNYCVSQYADVCNQVCNTDADCPNGYICEGNFYCETGLGYGYTPTCLQIDYGYSVCATYPGLNNLPHKI